MSDERTRAELPADTGNATHEQQASGASDLGRHLHPRSAWFEPKCYLCWQDEAQKMTASALTLSDEVRTLRSQNQALQERAEKAEKLARDWEDAAHEDRLHGMALQEALREIRDWNEHGGRFTGTHAEAAVTIADAALSPTQETDPG